MLYTVFLFALVAPALAFPSPKNTTLVDRHTIPFAYFGEMQQFINTYNTTAPVNWTTATTLLNKWASAAAQNAKLAVTDSPTSSNSSLSGTAPKSNGTTPSSSASSSASSSSSSKSTKATPSAVSPITSIGDPQTFLDRHNNLRARYGAQPVSWNTSLALLATTYAKECRFRAKPTIKDAIGVTTNLGVDTSPSIARGFADWVLQSSSYNWKKPGLDDSTADFTQIVWKNTTQIGCAANTCPAGTFYHDLHDHVTDNLWFMVCEYYPPGNTVDIYSAANTIKNFQNNVGQLVK